MATKGDITELDELLYGGLPVIPMVTGYSQHKRSGIIQSNVDGGLTRQRKKFYNQAYIAEVTYRLETIYQQDHMKIFFERNEGKRFIAHLVADRPILEPYVVQVVSEWQNNYVSGVDGTLTVTMEIISVRDKAFDDYIFGVYGLLGDDTGPWYTGINQVVFNMPVV